MEFGHFGMTVLATESQCYKLALDQSQVTAPISSPLFSHGEEVTLHSCTAHLTELFSLIIWLPLSSDLLNFFHQWSFTCMLLDVYFLFSSRVSKWTFSCSEYWTIQPHVRPTHSCWNQGIIFCIMLHIIKIMQLTFGMDFAIGNMAYPCNTDHHHHQYCRYCRLLHHLCQQHQW